MSDNAHFLSFALENLLPSWEESETVYFLEKYSSNFHQHQHKYLKRKTTHLKVFSAFKPRLGLRSLLNTRLYPMGTGGEMRATPSWSQVCGDCVRGTSRCTQHTFLNTSGSQVLHFNRGL